MTNHGLQLQVWLHPQALNATGKVPGETMNRHHPLQLRKRAKSSQFLRKPQKCRKRIFERVRLPEVGLEGGPFFWGGA